MVVASSKKIGWNSSLPSSELRWHQNCHKRKWTRTQDHIYMATRQKLESWDEQWQHVTAVTLYCGRWWGILVMSAILTHEVIILMMEKQENSKKFPRVCKIFQKSIKTNKIHLFKVIDVFSFAFIVSWTSNINNLQMMWYHSWHMRQPRSKTFAPLLHPTAGC